MFVCRQRPESFFFFIQTKIKMVTSDDLFQKWKKNGSNNSHWEDTIIIVQQNQHPTDYNCSEHCENGCRTSLNWKSFECPLKKPYACSTHSYSLRSSGVCISRSSNPWISLSVCLKRALRATHCLCLSPLFGFILLILHSETRSVVSRWTIYFYFLSIHTHAFEPNRTDKTHILKNAKRLLDIDNAYKIKKKAQKKKTKTME